MAILLRRSVRSSWVPQAACDSVRRPEPPTEEAAVKGRHVHGCGGRHQVATPLSLSLSPLTTLIAAILSAHHGSHDFPMSAWNADPSGRLSGPCTHSRMYASCRLRTAWPGC